MLPSIGEASPAEIAALWRLNLLSGDDVAAVCMDWLEGDLDHGDAAIAALAGQSGLVRDEIATVFERVLKDLVGRTMDRDEAILRALRFHLASALTGDDLVEEVQLVINRFGALSSQRLVVNPRRTQDNPGGVYAEQNLGLEYVYGGFYAFDDIWHLGADDQLLAERELLVELRLRVHELNDHLTAMVGDEASNVSSLAKEEGQ
jgi:hypothetical protein